jgi:hypothetical protein
MGYEEWLITLPKYLREIVKESPENKTYIVKPINNPDDLRTDNKYWALILRSHGLGMNRGTEKRISPEEKAIEESIAVAKAKRGRPEKETKSDFSRSSLGSGTDNFFGTFSFRTYPSKPHSVGTHPSARNNSVRNMTGGKGDRGMIVYIGGSSDLARLEENQTRAKSGRVTPPGSGPDR